MLKKAIYSVSGLAAVAAPVATVVSCGSTAEISKDKSVILVTDGGSIDDKSFNEQAYNSLKEITGLSKPGTDYYLKPAAFGDKSEIQKQYTAAESVGKEYVLAPGFNHVDAITEWNTNKPDSKLKFIVADSGDLAASNVAGITYETQASGFEAGYLAGLYLNAIGDTTPIVGTFGGAVFPGVTDFMVGFVNGVKYYNANKPAGDVDLKFATFGSDVEYTNSGFDVGGGTAKATTLTSKGADIILPVAGPQTADVLALANVKVIGVDTDQAKQYSSQADRFLTSILKNIKDSLTAVFKKIKGDASVDASIKGLNETTIGTLDNHLTGIAESTIGLPSGSTVDVKALYTASTSPTIVTAAEAALKDSAQNTWASALAFIKANPAA